MARESKARKAQRELREAWSKALAEGRVIRFLDFGQMYSYPTAEMRDSVIAQCEAQGIRYRVVVVDEYGEAL